MAANERHDDGLGNVPANLLTLRRRLKMSQQEFVQTYLTEDGRPLISVATMSNMERGSLANIDRLRRRLAASMGVEEAVFGMEPDAFAKNVDLFFSRHLAKGEEARNGRMEEIRSASNVEVLVRLLSDYLMDFLIGGKLKPGDSLPSDRQLSVMFNAGRTPIREALKVLSVLGLIQIVPGKGTFVASRSTDMFFTPLSWSFLLGQATTSQIVDVRNVLETESARLAAVNATPESREELVRIFGEMARAYRESDFRLFYDLDIEFHLQVARCSANPIILNMLQTSRKLLSHISKSGVAGLGAPRANFEEHSAIYEAVMKGDSDLSREVMAHHLEMAKRRYQSHN